MLKQFTESGGQSVKLLIPLNSCTPNCGFGALLPTSKSTPRNSGRAEELRTSERRLDKMEFASLSSSFPLVSVDDDDTPPARTTVRLRDEDTDDVNDDGGGLRVIGTTCMHNASMIVVVVVVMCFVCHVKSSMFLNLRLSQSFSMFLLSDDDALSAPAFLRVPLPHPLSILSLVFFFFYDEKNSSDDFLQFFSNKLLKTVAHLTSFACSEHFL